MVRAPAAPLPRFQPDLQSALLAQAYAAFERGSIAEAQRLYNQAAARQRGVDALLGLAAVAIAQNRDADAQRLYREILDMDPRNAVAQGALLDLLGSTDTPAAESRLKTLIEREPSAHLYQSLGNLYANQGRWNDAQAAYFEAWRSAPANADYAYNLAVSLDQLGERTAALTYYQKALASDGAHRFDRAAAEARVQQLKPAH
jgi:tetratricopeptide (TPR) repeat protein